MAGGGRLPPCTTPEGGATPLGAYMREEPRNKFFISKCTTHTVYFWWFVREVDMGVGSKSMPDYSISIELMNILMENI